ncbi:putative sulfate exporter family transporter [Halarcobacter sp.]|uniref:YeiH family protein n=1 Tax=Halarcobacter sp. TaxID=2321133 RepID=UPI002AAAEE55|nr:putative sulfate exporter family transporter [Halarcobacter sp.]
MNKIYGLLLCMIVAGIATLFSSYIPIGSVAIAIILGAILGNSITIPSKFASGITFAEKSLLSFSIALMGINLDFNVLNALGANTILIIVISLIATIFFALYVSKKQDFDKKLGLILGIGNAVCGSAAIAATKDIVKLNKEKSALAIAIVNLLGTAGLFILPFIGLLLGFNDIEIGILLGNTLQSVGHAVAAGFGVNETVGQSATIVKMGRILLLTPVIIWLIFFISKKNTKSAKNTKRFQIPLFILGFIFFSIIASIQILPQNIIDYISLVSKISLLLAMSAIGLKISFKAIKESGWDALVLAGYIFKFQILLSIVLIAIF